MPQSATAPRRRQPRRRSTVACKACNARKVRCTVSFSGPPCANCAVDGVSCEVSGRKRRHNPDLLPTVPTETDESGSVDNDNPRQPRKRTALTEGSRNDQDLHSGPEEHLSTSAGPSRQTRSSKRHTLTSTEPGLINWPDAYADSPASVNPERRSDPSDTAEDRSAYAKALEPRRGQEESCGPFYAGDNRGLTFIMDICGSDPSSKSSHFLVPIPSIKSLEPEDLVYLRAKGSFSLPPANIRDSLIRCYFHHIHPISPILEAEEFIAGYEKGKASLLLLWSMFVASASFIDTCHLTDDFFPTRTLLKQAMYRRAKSLYDADYERNKIVLIQSVFLLSHWFTGTEDRTGPWYWNGIAITLSHTIGLHALPSSTTQATSAYRPFWRRLWWSIYAREAWLSQAQGRPMRIRPDDADTAMPTPSDVSPAASSATAHRYLPDETGELLHRWLGFTRLSAMLGNVLVMSYGANGPRPSAADLHQAESEIRACCHSEMNEAVAPSAMSRSQFHQLSLYVEAVIIVLYRPWILDTPASTPASEESEWRSLVCRKTRTAASRAIAAVNAIMSEDIVGLCHSITVLALLPIMQIHLFESTSSNPVAREMGKHNLALCMVIMDELRKVYLAADAAYKLFETAIQKVNSRTGRDSDACVETDATRVSEDTANETSHDWNEGFELWPDGIMADLWTPQFTTLGNELDGNQLFGGGWMDIQSMERNWGLNDMGIQ